MRKSESSGEGAVGVGVVGDLSVTDDPAPDGGVATHPSPTNGIKGGEDTLRRRYLKVERASRIKVRKFSKLMCRRI